MICVLVKSKSKNVNRLSTGQLNINLLANKFDQLKMIIGNIIDILIITETKIYSSFPDCEFIIDWFSMSFRLDRNWFVGWGCGLCSGENS